MVGENLVNGRAQDLAELVGDFAVDEDLKKKEFLVYLGGGNDGMREKSFFNSLARWTCKFGPSRGMLRRHIGWRHSGDWRLRIQSLALYHRLCEMFC